MQRSHSYRYFPQFYFVILPPCSKRIIYRMARGHCE
jgi:hypothetical protein